MATAVTVAGERIPAEVIDLLGDEGDGDTGHGASRVAVSRRGDRGEAWSDLAVLAGMTVASNVAEPRSAAPRPPASRSPGR